MTLEERARRLWPNHPTYQAKWIEIVQWLGRKWLLHDDPEPRAQSLGGVK